MFHLEQKWKLVRMVSATRPLQFDTIASAWVLQMGDIPIRRGQTVGGKGFQSFEALSILVLTALKYAIVGV
jgi:hypothetical protein